MKPLTIGVLSLQGCVTPHFPHLEALGVNYLEVKAVAQMEQVDGYILPGGESSTMLRLMDHYNLKEKIKQELLAKPTWGICAGSILMAKKVRNVDQFSFGVIDYEVTRNGYGRQVDSQEVEINGYPVCFIRAPILTNLSKHIEVLARHQGEAVWVTSGQYMATTFHPELTQSFPSPMHQHFLEIVKKSRC